VFFEKNDFGVVKSPIEAAEEKAVFFVVFCFHMEAHTKNWLRQEKGFSRKVIFSCFTTKIQIVVYGNPNPNACFRAFK
jgi:hypothetical protein